MVVRLEDGYYPVIEEGQSGKRGGFLTAARIVGRMGVNRFLDRNGYLRQMPYEEFLKSVYWKDFKVYLLGQRGAKCEQCGTVNSALELHHLTYEHRGLEFFYQNEIQILCRACHEAQPRL
jgi:hypothetical protein